MSKPKPIIPDHLSRRKRRIYDAGWNDSLKKSDASTAALAARNESWKLSMDLTRGDRLERQLEIERAANEKLQRDLQFANDRIEQLQNSVVIIRDGKK
jgi:hypothetical protein